MTKEEIFYQTIGQKIKNAIQSQLFGKPCFKINGKAFVCFFQNEMVFKLNGNSHFEAINLEGSKLFDPSGKQRPMKEWIKISNINSELWDKFAIEAAKYVSSKYFYNINY
ncbi:MAG: hypothetical protein ACOYO1_13825 [Bacteroidales bacterium]